MRGRSRKNPPTPWAGGSCAVFLRGVDGGDPDFFQLRAFAGHLCIFPEKKNTDRPEGQSVFLVGEDGFPPSEDKLRLHLPGKEKYRPSRRTIGIFGGGRWISPDGDKLRLHLPRKEKYQSPKRVIGIFVFGDRNYWHPVTMRFPVCFKKFF